MSNKYFSNIWIRQMDELPLIVLGVVVPIIIVIGSGGLKTLAFRNGAWHCHDYHLGVEFALAHLAVCGAVFFDVFRRVKAAQHLAKPNEQALDLIQNYPTVTAWLGVFAFFGVVTCVGLLIGYQRLKLPYVDSWGNTHAVQGHIVRVGNLKNTFGLSHDFWLGVILFNTFAIILFALLLVWMLHHS